MEQSKLIKWLQDRTQLNAESVLRLRATIEKYPYFQTARLLYLQNLYILQSSAFEDALRESCLYIADLKVLFHAIHGVDYRVQEDDNAHSSAEPSGDRTLDLIDQFLSAHGGEQATQLPNRPAIPDYLSLLEYEAKEKQKKDSFEVIDNFLSAAHEIKSETEALPVETASSTDESAQEEVEVVTERMAHIYIKQQRYEQALEIIRKLELKNQNKSVYFADQIRFLEKLIINSK